MGNNDEMWRDPRMAKCLTLFEGLMAAPARRLIEQAGLSAPTENELVILDNGCGSGTVTAMLMEMLDHTTKQRMTVTCGDKSESMVASSRERIEEEKWSGVEAKVVDGENMPLPDETYTHVLSNFVINGMENGNACLKECHRILKTGGTCGFTTWKRLEWATYIREAIATIPEAPEFPDSDHLLLVLTKDDWHVPDFVEKRLNDAGFTDIKVELAMAPFRARNTPEFVQSFSPMLAEFLKKIWLEKASEIKMERINAALTEYFEEKFGKGQPFGWDMTAIVASGRKV